MPSKKTIINHNHERGITMRIIFAGGGTGGHINPAISIADYMRARDKDFEALFIGTQHGLETKLVPKAGYEIKYIDICGFNRKNMLKNVSVVKKLIKANEDCVKIMKEFKPDAVVCTGGYVSGPVTVAAKKCKIPSMIHEQNVYPGLTVKASQSYVNCVAVSFSETLKHLKKDTKAVVTGNPVREEILSADKATARQKLGISDNEKFVIIFGGSLGAEKINDATCKMIPMIEDEKLRILFATGEKNFADVSKALADCPSNITVTPYINNMAEVMAAADLAVTRSGAITVSELACLNKPAIMIPSPNVVRNHQEQNAKEFTDADAAIMLKECDLTPKSLYDAVCATVSNSEKLANMAKNMEKLAKRDALEEIGEVIYNMVEEK